MTKAVSKRDLRVVRECLALGLPLEITERGGVRRFTAGSVTGKVKGQWVETTHLMPNPAEGRVWINADYLARLADQARGKLEKKDELLAAQAARRAAFLDR